jgi:ectoine hydroxylase-related dioxygenase (phytanoyl-CoA dioxygenase family)
VKEDFERDGFVVVPGALGRTEVRRLEAAVDRVWANTCGSQSALHLLAFVGLDDAFLELVDHAACLPLVADVLGWNIYAYHCHLDIHPPEPAAEPRWRWHQDGGRQNVELGSPRPRLSVKVAWFLTDVATAEHGALRVVPGSHLQDSLSRDYEPPDAVPVTVRAGDAVIFDRRLWHARGDNTSDRTRKALFYGYTHRWIRPRDDLGVEPGRIAALSPLRRQLLGHVNGNGSDSYWFPAEDDVPLRALRSRMPLKSRVVAMMSSQSG